MHCGWLDEKGERQHCDSKIRSKIRPGSVSVGRKKVLLLFSLCGTQLQSVVSFESHTHRNMLTKQAHIDIY